MSDHSSKRELAFVAITTAEAVLQDAERLAEEKGITGAMLEGAIWNEITRRHFARGLTIDQLTDLASRIADQVEQYVDFRETEN